MRAERMNEWVDSPFGITLPFTDEITRADTEKGALGFRCDGFREVRLARTRWAI